MKQEYKHQISCIHKCHGFPIIIYLLYHIRFWGIDTILTL